MTELLMPAGNIEKLEYTINYGANAVYMGMVDFSLRSMRKGELITSENISYAVERAHQLGAKAYVTANIFAFNKDIDHFYSHIDTFKKAKPDAIIFSDVGIFRVLKKELPEIPLHVSTQANNLNYENVRFWQDLGVERVILSRELSIPEIAEIKAKVPDMEIEVFVHGAQCVSFSGRCLLSDYMTSGERKANQGGCCQPCRWSYKLIEETRPNEQYEICQDDRGTHILSPKDLALVKYIPQLIEAGVDSLKVEGRTKSIYYASAVAKTYRRAIDGYYNKEEIDYSVLFEELKKVGNRGYTTGFYIDGNPSDSYSYDISKGLAGADFLFLVLDKQGEKYKVKIKNKILVNDEIEIISPNEQFTTRVNKIYNRFDEAVDCGNTNDEVFVELEQVPSEWKYALARTIGVKEH